jgi:hypothetical protein
MSLPITEEALALILEAEGLDQPGKWPGESSGKGVDGLLKRRDAEADLVESSIE